MRPKSSSAKKPAEQVVKDIRRATRRHFSAEDKIRIVLDGLRGDDSIAELCRKEGIAQSLYYVWSKEFMEAGKRRLAGDGPAPAPPARRYRLGLSKSSRD
jgi:transposase